MKKLVPMSIVVLLFLCLVGSVAACGDEAAPETTAATAGPVTSAPTEPAPDAKVLRLTAPWPVGDVHINNVQAFADAFNAAQTQYEITVHPGGQLMALNDSFEALKTGAVEMAGWPLGPFASIVPEFGVAELPFSLNTIEADAAMNVEMMKVYDKVLTEKHGMKPLFVETCQGLDLISVEPVKTLEDWNGLLSQAMSPVVGRVVEALGGAGVAMEFTEGYQAFSKKVIEATPQSGSMIVMFKLYEVAKYLTKCYMMPAATGFFINLDVLNEMPKDIQDLIVKLGLEAQATTNANMIQLYYENYDTMAAQGMTVYSLPSAERDKWAEKVKPYAEELLGELDPATAEQVRALVQKFDGDYPYPD